MSFICFYPSLPQSSPKEKPETLKPDLLPEAARTWACGYTFSNNTAQVSLSHLCSRLLIHTFVLLRTVCIALVCVKQNLKTQQPKCLCQSRKEATLWLVLKKKSFLNYTTILIRTWQSSLNFWDWISHELASYRFQREIQSGLSCIKVLILARTKQDKSGSILWCSSPSACWQSLT